MKQFYQFSKLVGAAVVLLATSVNSGAQTTNFAYTGAVQTYTVPAGVTALAIEAAGGKGGDNNNWPSGIYPSQGGNGGRVVCSLAVTGGQVLAINVGGQGMVGTFGVNASGGYNGGGTGGYSGGYSGGGGGGATDISIGGNKVIVAGGGGGAGLDYPGGNMELGGAGGDLIGGNGYFNGSNTNSSGGFGGTQTAGGNNGSGGGAAGSLGAGGDAYLSGASGGGGGGYYGGGGGGSAWAGGGGGSSYTDAVFATGVTQTQAANTGNGYAIVTVLNAIPTFVNGPTHDTFLCQYTTSIDVSSTLAMTDGDAGELQTFTMYEAPVNGSLTGFPTTLTATAGTDAPSGIVYTPTTGYFGDDSFKVIVTDPNAASDTITVYVTVYPQPGVTATSDVAICNGLNTTDIVFSGSVSGTAFSWTNDNTTIGLPSNGNGDILSFAATNSGTTNERATIIVTPTANGCTGTADTFTITVYPTPTVDASGDQAACNTGSTSAVFFTGAVSGTTFDWTNDNATIGLAASGSGDIMSFTATNSGTANEIANIVVTPTANSCPGATDTFIITVYPTSDVAATSDQTVCNTVATTNVIFSGVVSGTTFDWTNDKTAIGLAASGSGDIMSFTAANSGTLNDTATIIVTPTANGCPGATDTFTIVVYPTPNVDPTADMVFCNTVTTSAVIFTGAVSGTSFNWINDNTTTGLAASGTGDITPFTASNSSAATTEVSTVIVLPVANGCPGNTDTFTVAVYPTPDFTVPSNQTLCDGAATTTVNFTGTPSGVTFSWTNSTPSIGLAATGTGDITSFTATSTSPAVTTATISATPSANGCAGTAKAFNITVNPTPMLSSSLTPPAICDSSTFTYSATTATTGATLLWFRPAVAGIVASATGGLGDVSEQLINSTNTNVTVGYTYLLTANGCTNTQTVNVVVHPTPRMSSDSTDVVCSGSLFTYTPASFVPTGVSYAWSRASVAGINPSTGSGTNNINETLTNSTTTPVTATYVYTLTIGGCTHNELVKLTVNPNPGAPDITTIPASVCDNTMFQNVGTSSASANYSWSAINATVYAVGSTRQYALVNFTEPGIAKVIVTNTAGTTGCGNADTATVSVSSSSSMEGIYVMYHNGQLICLRNDVDSYTWGYDDASTLAPTVIPGETHANYFISSLATDARNYWVITTKDGCSQKSYYNKPAGVEEVNTVLSANLNVYPNPANDVINVDIATAAKGNVEIDVFNIVGQKVRTVPARGNKATISVAELSAGMYVVDCYIEGVKVGSSKFIKN